MCAIKWFLCTICLLVLSEIDSVVGNNHVNGSILVFADLNDTRFDYKLGDYLTESAESEWLLGPYVTFAKNVILMFVHLDLEWIKSMYLGEESFEIIPAVKKVIPILVVVAIGIFLSLVVPILGFCFCICRCCGRCGGRLTVENAKKQKSSCGIVNFILLVICCLMLLVGAGSIWTVGQRIPNVGNHIANVAKYTVADVITFTDQLFQDLMQIAVDDVNFVTAVLAHEIQTMPEQILLSFLEETQPQIDDIIASVESFGVAKQTLATTITAIETTITEINILNDQVQSNMTAIDADLEQAHSDCLSDGLTNCNDFIRGDDVPRTNFSEVPDITTFRAISDGAMSMNQSAILNQINGAFDDVPNMINDSTWNIREQSLGVLHNISTLIEPMLETTKHVFENGTDVLKDIETEVENKSEEFAPLLVKVTFVFMIVSGVVLFILLFDVIGILFGLANARAKAPEHRKTIGHLGSHCIMVSVFFSFCFIFIYLFLGSVLMVMGSLLTIVCHPVRDLTIFSDLFDDPAMWDNSYIMAERLIDNGSVPLTISGILQDCENDSATYTALKIKYRVDIETLVDIEAQLPDLTPITGIVHTSLDNVQLFDNSTVDNLNIIANSSAPFLDPTASLTNMTAQISGFTLTTFINDLDDLGTTMNIIPTTSYATEMYRIANVMRTINNTIVPQIDNKVILLQSQLNDLVNLPDIMPEVQEILNKALNFENYLQSQGGNTIADSASSYIDRILSFAQQTLSHVARRLAQNVAKCSLVWDVYDASTGIVCVYFLDAFNGLWLSLMIVGIFLIGNVWFGVRMVKYFRRPVDAHVFRRTQEQGNPTVNSTSIDMDHLHDVKGPQKNVTHPPWHMHNRLHRKKYREETTFLMTDHM